MSEKRNDIDMSEAGRTADENKTLSEADKNDILQLVRYWATEIIDLDFTSFVYGSSGSSEWRTREFANRRLDTISKLIGERRRSGWPSRLSAKTSISGLGGYSRKVLRRSRNISSRKCRRSWHATPKGRK